MIETRAETGFRDWTATLGAQIHPDGVQFRVWAPTASVVEVVCFANGEPSSSHRLTRNDDGYHDGLVVGATPGTRYKYKIGGEIFPDPCSRSQPDGVHGSSEVVDPYAFEWTDQDWSGLVLDDLVIYELHVGTFTPEGTLDSAIERLDHLVDLGVTAIEVMPVASFSGERNWGYDGVALFAPANCYGGPDAFKRFVNAAHRRGIGVMLDVVYNHLGPDGNVLPAITGGRFFTDRHTTPWGDAINFDGPDSGPVREFVIENALYWAHEFHIDGLRLDAVHAIVDESRVHILRELADRLHALHPRRIVIAEDERNERQLVEPVASGGFGLDGVWADDLHHQLRRLSAGDTEGYFRSYAGTIADVVCTLNKGWFFEGQWSDHTEAPRGTSAEGLSPRVFVHCIQNHDQVGNRAMGDRLSSAVPAPVYRALSALLLFSPYTPLIWMGQEWAASTPFLYFTDHPARLGATITKGRREEFRHVSAFSNPRTRTRIPDPQDESTFLASRLQWSEMDESPHREMAALYRALLALRRTEPTLRDRSREGFAVMAIDDGALVIRRGLGNADQFLLIVGLTEGPHVLPSSESIASPPPGRRWHLLLSTEERRFGGDIDLANLPIDALRVTGAGASLFRADSIIEPLPAF